jgi:isochorismate hydrolase
MQAFRDTDRKQAVLAGIEAHVCVYQTAVDLKQKGFEVEVVADAVSSRTAENRRIGLEKIKQAGCGVTGTETVLFELLKKAEGPAFKEILKIVK